MFVIIVTIMVTIFVIYIYNQLNTAQQSEHIGGPDETRFYSRLTPRNKILRPPTRYYYEPSDTRVPERIRIPVTRAFQKAVRDFPLVFPVTQPVIQFASGDTEGGMPHTLDNRVIVPLRESLSSDPASQLWTTMIHELCHIHQRQYPAGWGRLYTKLGFIPLSINEIPTSIQKDNIVANPDAGSSGMPQIGWWSYKGQVGVLVFKESPTTIRDHHSVVYPVTPPGAANGVNHLKEDFGELCGQYDHPNEISACLIANHWDTIIRPPSNSNAQLKSTDPRLIVRRWLRESIPTNE